MAEIAVPAVRDWDFPRSAASILLISQFAAERGAGPDDVLRGTALTSGQLLDPAVQVDARQELAVIRNVAGRLGDEDTVALALGRRYHVTTFGIFGFACISSPTLRDAMAFALRYLDLSFTFCIPHIAVDGEKISLTLNDERVPGNVARFLALRDLSAIYTVMRDLLPSVKLRTLSWRHGKPATIESYVDVFGVRPQFGADTNMATLDLAYLDHPLPQANEHTVAICEAQCRELVARELNLSARTLRRRLTEAGTSYRALVDEVRQTLAEEMLGIGALSVEDVAIRLGYAEASSFIYAFKRWKGVTPAAYVRRFAGRGQQGR